MDAATQPSHRIPALDGFRGFAVLWVFLYHYGGGATSHNALLQAFGAFCRLGWAGVTFFFVLSGFLITRILSDGRRAPNFLRSFCARRALRILPLYYGAIVLCLVSAFFIAGGTGFRLRYYFAPLLFLLDFPRHSDAWVANLPSRFSMYHLWSLSVEEQFYLLWPLVCVRIRSRVRCIGLCAAVFAASLAFRCVTAAHGSFPVWFESLPARAGELALGALLALTCSSDSARGLRAIASCGFGASVVVFVWGVSRAPAEAATNTELTAASFLAASLLVLSLQRGLIQSAFRFAWLRTLGRWSFGIYIFHVLFLPQFHWIANKIAGSQSGAGFLAIRFAVAAVGSVSLAALSFHFYESRFLKLRSRFPLAPVTARVASAASGARY